ncbi:MAG: methyl-accepting chemotaxis protein, partial [Candidatus Heimdallarchaeota archaeon]
YLELKQSSNSISAGVDSFTSVFDESLNSNEDVVSVIKSIGRQINMLALNAGIEAARAGEMGIGFEVVSDNLRRLSQHAVTTTSDMKMMRSTINTEARIALETITASMNQLVGNIDDSYASVSNINNELFQIKQNLVDISDDMSDIQQFINIIGTELQLIKK